eukprot:scaffold5778_cov100-Phaeocystis_antarctica.AAC.1
MVGNQSRAILAPLSVSALSAATSTASPKSASFACDTVKACGAPRSTSANSKISKIASASAPMLLAEVRPMRSVCPSTIHAAGTTACQAEVVNCSSKVSVSFCSRIGMNSDGGDIVSVPSKPSPPSKAASSSTGTDNPASSIGVSDVKIASVSRAAINRGAMRVSLDATTCVCASSRLPARGVVERSGAHVGCGTNSAAHALTSSGGIAGGDGGRLGRGGARGNGGGCGGDGGGYFCNVHTAQLLLVLPPSAPSLVQQRHPHDHEYGADHMTESPQPFVCSAIAKHSCTVSNEVPRLEASAPQPWSA